MKALVIFYSRTGTTERVAGLLAERLRSQGVEVTIEPVRTEAKLGIVSCIRQMMAKVNPDLAQPVPDVSGYDLVFLGFPVWADMPASPVNSILGGLKAPGGRRFALFATCGLSEGHKAALSIVTSRLVEMGHEVVAGRGFLRGFLRKQPLPATAEAAGEFIAEVLSGTRLGC